MNDAKRYTQKVKGLYQDFKELSGHPEVARQANEGLQAVQGLMARVGKAGLDLVEYHPALGVAYRAVMKPILDGQIFWLEAKLAMLRAQL